ncbi:MAG: hypothetical protein ACRDZW_00290, partial [Acidimicrobiales bacterium]
MAPADYDLAETRLRAEVAAGVPTDLTQDGTLARPVDVAGSPGRRVRGHVVAELCRSATRPVELYGACIEGDVDLSNCTGLPAVALSRCLILGRLALGQAELVALDLRGTEIRLGPQSPVPFSVDAGYVTIKAEVLLGPGFEADAPVNLQGADVGGVIDAREARLHGRGEWSLDLAGATVGQDLYLTGVETSGGVNLSSIDLRGQV